jgi:hypothetical protein
MSRAWRVSFLFCAGVLLAGCGRLGFEIWLLSEDADASVVAPGDAGSPAPRDAGHASADAGPGATDAGPPGAIVVSDLRVEWTTAHTIRWRWSLDGPVDSFARMELVVAESPEDVESRSGSARVIRPQENPELGVPRLLFTQGDDPSVVTITFDHAAATTYHAELVAYDTDGAITRSGLALGTTTSEPTDAVVIFEDAPTDGYSIPGEVVHSSAHPLRGTHAYDYRRVCDPPAERCYENIRRQGLAIDASAITADRFEEAYLEWAVRVDDPSRHSYYSAVRLMLGDGGSTELFHFEALTIRAGGAYRVYEFPLRRLGSRPMTAADLASRPIFEFGFGGGWPSGATVSFDEVRLRY